MPESSSGRSCCWSRVLTPQSTARYTMSSHSSGFLAAWSVLRVTSCWLPSSRISLTRGRRMLSRLPLIKMRTGEEPARLQFDSLLGSYLGPHSKSTSSWIISRVAVRMARRISARKRAAASFGWACKMSLSSVGLSMVVSLVFLFNFSRQSSWAGGETTTKI